MSPWNLRNQAGEYMKRQAGRQFYKLVVVVWLTFSIGSVLLAIVSWLQLSARMTFSNQITGTRNELNGVTQSLLSLLNAESGYVITGDKKYVGRSNDAAANLPARFDRLLTLVHDDPQLLEQVTQLRADTELILKDQREVVAARERSFDRAAALIATGEVQGITDKTLAQAAELDQICLNKQESIGEEILSRVIHANLTTLVAGLFGIGAGLLALWLSYVALKQQERERELIEAKLQAEHHNQEKTTFLANMSHEIRTPMNAILGFSELLQTELREPKHRQYLQSIRSSADSLLQLINDILDMSKIEAGVLELHPEPTDLREICDFIRTLFSESAARKGIKLECHVAADLPHAIVMDRTRLRQILVNLVGNAVKFTDKGGVELRVSWEKQPTNSHVSLIIEVEDTGVGIPKDKLDSIFKPFVQAGAHRDKEKQGTGLGLSIVKRVTETMGGTVSVTSSMELGST